MDSLPLLLSGIAYFLILPAILGIRPFEVVGAAQEISSGPKAEFGGKFLAFSTIQHALHVIYWYFSFCKFVSRRMGFVWNFRTHHKYSMGCYSRHNRFHSENVNSIYCRTVYKCSVSSFQN